MSIYQRCAEGIHVSVVLKVPPNPKTIVLEIRQSWVPSCKYSDRNACLSTGRAPAPLQLLSPALVVGKVRIKTWALVLPESSTGQNTPFLLIMIGAVEMIMQTNREHIRICLIISRAFSPSFSL